MSHTQPPAGPPHPQQPPYQGPGQPYQQQQPYQPQPGQSGLQAAQQPPPQQQPPQQPPPTPQQPPRQQPPPQQPPSPGIAPQQPPRGGQTYDQSGQPTSPGQQQPLPAREAQPSPPRDKAAEDKAKAEQRDLSQAASIGAQVILDYNSDAGVAARGGAAGTIEENTEIRDANLLAIGLNPQAPSGPPTGEPYESPEAKAPQPKHVGPSATKMTSLAAGIQEVPTPPVGDGGSTTTVARRTTT